MTDKLRNTKETSKDQIPGFSQMQNSTAGFTPTPFPKKGVSLQSKRGFTPTPFPKKGVSLQSKRGFTLIELLVVIAIIGLLSSVVLASVNSAREKGRIARARADLNQLRIAVEFLYDDTGQSPNHQSINPCVQNPEAFLDDAVAGIGSTDGSFPNWGGPYMQVPIDPWGGRYMYDPDYYCTGSPIGCEGFSSTAVRALHSGGSNGSGINVYDSDNIVLVLCQ